jgi:hypothetical protein
VADDAKRIGNAKASLICFARKNRWFAGLGWAKVGDEAPPKAGKTVEGSAEGGRVMIVTFEG